MNARVRVFGRAAFMGATLSVLTALSVSAQGRGGPPEKPLPLPSPRTADFTATEGTWISLDVSPDGKTIVFDLLGDLYTMPIAGGRAIPLLVGMAYETQPRFSPDGTKIAFVSDRSGGDNLWTMSLDLTDTTQVSRGNGSLYVSPEWTPDGQYVVVSRSGGLGGSARMVMFHAERGSPIPLATTPATMKTMGAAFSPDGRFIWYAARSGDWQYNARLPQYQVYRYDRETSESTLLTNRWGSGFRPAISPDGNWLIYGTRFNTDTGLRKRDLRTGGEDWLAYPVQRDDQESRAPLDVLPGYSFMPDGSAIVVSYGGKIWSVPMDGSAAAEIPLEVPVKLAVGPEVKFAYQMDTTTLVTASQIRSPVASPDGSRIVFTAFDRLWIKAIPDGEARRVTEAEVGEFHPKWSPDGRSIAYVTWDDVAGGHIMRVPADGSAAPTQLTGAAAMYYNPAWSSDGTRVVATRAAARELKEAPDLFFGPVGSQFVWVPAAGGDVTDISPSGSRDYMHFRTGETDRIYAYSPREGLVSFRWDGTDVQQHLRVVGAPGGGGIGDPHPSDWEYLPQRVFPSKKATLPTDTGPTDLDPAAEPPGAPPAGLVILSPNGDRALAQVGSDIFVVDLAEVGETPPTVMTANLAGAPVPVRRLTDVGGEFPAWSADGESVYWAMGNVLFTYDLSFVEDEEDATEDAQHAAALLRVRASAVSDTLKTKRAVSDSLTKAPTAVPDSLTREIRRLAADSVQVQADQLVQRADSMRAAADKIASKATEVRAGNDALLADTTDTYEAVERKIQAQLPRDVPRGTVVLRGGRVVTMNGDRVIENGVVVVTDNKIVAVGTRDSVTVPEGAEVIDVTGKTLLPGFVDTHYHSMWLVPEIHTSQVWQYLTTLSFGVTTTRDPQTAFTDVLSYGDRVATGGLIGPRVYSTGPGVFVGENIRDADHAKTVLRRYAEYFQTKTLKMYMTGNRQQRQWIIQAAKALEIMPTTEGGLDFKLELTHAIDGYPGIEHALPVAPIFGDVVELFKTSQTTNTPTLLVSYGGPFGENYYYATEDVHGNEKMNRFVPHANIDMRSRRRGPGAGGSPGQAGWFLPEEYVFPKHGEWVKKLIEGGGRAGVGSHGQLQGLGYHWELWAMGSGGASNHDVLRAATIMGAEAIGFGSEVGSIEEGKFADIVIFDANPLDDLRNSLTIDRIMRNGRLYDGDTLAEQWPEQRPAPVLAHQTAGPEGVRAGVRGGN